MLKHNDPTPTTIDRYLADLRRRLEAELPSERVDDLVAETESHLREREAALREMEAGQPELEAVRGFVAASQQASELVRSDAGDRWTLRARRLRIPVFWAVAALPLLGPFIAPLTESVHPFLVLLPAGLAVLASVSFLCKLGEPRRLRNITFCVAFAGAIAFSPPVLDLTDLGGMASARRELRAQAADWDLMARAQEEQLAAATAELRLWAERGSIPNEFPKNAGIYVTPPPSPGFVTYIRRSEEVRRARATKGRSWISLLKAKAAEYRATQLQHAVAASAPPDFVTAGIWFAWLLLAGLIAVLVDLGFARLGARIHQRRRRLKRR